MTGIAESVARNIERYGFEPTVRDLVPRLEWVGGTAEPVGAVWGQFWTDAGGVRRILTPSLDGSPAKWSRC